MYLLISITGARSIGSSRQIQSHSVRLGYTCDAGHTLFFLQATYSPSALRSAEGETNGFIKGRNLSVNIVAFPGPQH